MGGRRSHQHEDEEGRGAVVDQAVLDAGGRHERVPGLEDVLGGAEPKAPATLEDDVELVLAARAIFAILSGWSFAWSLTLMRIGRSRQQLYGMNELHVQTALPAPPGDLEEATRIRRGDHPRSGLGDACDLGVSQGASCPGLEEIVDARAAAAEVTVAELDEPEPGNPAEQPARLLSHALTVNQMAGVVVRHREVEGAQRQVGVGQQLRDIADPRRESRDVVRKPLLDPR